MSEIDRTLIITGASGFVARQIVPCLVSRGMRLLLVSRDPVSLHVQYPELEVCDYKELPSKLDSNSVVLHLATLNNNSSSEFEAFHDVNVIFLKDLIQTFVEKRIALLIYTSSLHSLNEVTTSAKSQPNPYAQTKRLAEILVQQTHELPSFTLRLPAIYGGEYAGNLRFLNNFPTFMRPILRSVLGAFKPILDAQILADRIKQISTDLKTGSANLSNGQTHNLAFTVVQKAINLAFVVFVAALLWWVLLIAWLAVKISSPGPGIFRQQRVGRHGVPFICYKFRTMRSGTPEVGTHETSVASVTSVGKFLRRTKIDELPQIVNLLKGEMVLVGPRPCLPVQKELIALRTDANVYSVLPGITGWSQINNIDMSEPARLAASDAEYVVRQSVLFDLSIIFKTLVGRGQGDRVDLQRS